MPTASGSWQPPDEDGRLAGLVRSPARASPVRGTRDGKGASGVTVFSVRIFVEGHPDDLYALSLLFPAGAHPEFEVRTEITGLKEGLLDRVQDASRKRTWITGDGCLPLALAPAPETAGWTARDIIAPLNGYAILADSNFRPVSPVHAEISDTHGARSIVFARAERAQQARLISVDRHPLLRELLGSRVNFMVGNRLAASAAAVIAGPPSWADYYRLLEDIAGHRGTTLDKLPEAGLATRAALDAFKNAANNRVSGRHGASKRSRSVLQEELMNLLEAREFVRRVVSTWLDVECGGRLPRDRVDGGRLRFGMDEGQL